MSVLDERLRHPMASQAATPRTFRRKRTLDDSAHRRRLVARAVVQAQAGDRDALRFLYSTYAENVYGYVCSLVHDDHEAEDITQHVFMKLMHVISRYEQRSMPFSAWILRVAHNAAIDHLRGRRAVPCEEIRGADERCDHAGAELGRLLRDALGELPDEQRRVVVLRHMVGLSPGEIAVRIGKSENAVHGLHHRGRRRLQEHLVLLGSAPATQAAVG